MILSSYLDLYITLAIEYAGCKITNNILTIVNFSHVFFDNYSLISFLLCHNVRLATHFVTTLGMVIALY